MFSEVEGSKLSDQLVAAVRADSQLEAAAVVGSAALGREGKWSDIDLAIRLATDLSPEDAVDQWTSRMDEIHDAVAHLDVWADRTLFRVFILASSLQIDWSFWLAKDFAASDESFRLPFDIANEPTPSSAKTTKSLIWMGWLYALHARSSIARGRALQAISMVNGKRDQVTALICLRHHLPSHQNRGVDDLPDDLKQSIAETAPRGLDLAELHRAFSLLASALLVEADNIDLIQGSRLAGPGQELVRTAVVGE